MCVRAFSHHSGNTFDRQPLPFPLPRETKSRHAQVVPAPQSTGVRAARLQSRHRSLSPACAVSLKYPVLCVVVSSAPEQTKATPTNKYSVLKTTRHRIYTILPTTALNHLRVFDRDRSGSLELDELTELFQVLGGVKILGFRATLIPQYDSLRNLGVL